MAGEMENIQGLFAEVKGKATSIWQNKKFKGIITTILSIIGLFCFMLVCMMFKEIGAYMRKNWNTLADPHG